MIAIVDSGSGNLRSVEKALVAVGATPTITSDPDTIRRADRVIVPGQGAFRDCMNGLKERGLDEAVREVVRSGRPYLGICLGLQVLFDESEEHGPCTGLGILPGRVLRFRPSDSDPALKVPHMGWNSLSVRKADPMWAGLSDDACVYFVHSYYVAPTDPSIAVLSCDYSLEFCAAVRKDNIFACQFHPEKSQKVGLKLLENFVNE